VPFSSAPSLTDSQLQCRSRVPWRGCHHEANLVFLLGIFNLRNCHNGGLVAVVVHSFIRLLYTPPPIQPDSYQRQSNHRIYPHNIQHNPPDCHDPKLLDNFAGCYPSRLRAEALLRSESPFPAMRSAIRIGHRAVTLPCQQPSNLIVMSSIRDLTLHPCLIQVHEKLTKNRDDTSTNGNDPAYARRFKVRHHL